MINPQWLELPMSRTNFHGPKDVGATEVRLYVRLCDFDNDIYKEKWLNYLQTVETWSDTPDLGLHCLPITLLGVSRLQWAKEMYSSESPQQWSLYMFEYFIQILAFTNFYMPYQAFFFILTLKKPSKFVADDILMYPFFISETIYLNISCESSACQTNHMKCQDLFSFKMLSAAAVIGA